MPLPHAIGLAACAAALVVLPPAERTTVDGVLLHHGWDVPSPADVRRNAALIDRRPFDGITVDLPGLSSTTLGRTVHPLGQYQQALAPLPRLRNVTRNLVVIRVQDGFPADFADDVGWGASAQNVENLARAAREKGGLVGIMLDTEHYGSLANPWDYGSSTTPWTATVGSAAPELARRLVERRGREFGSALFRAWPDAVLLTTYGPWVADPATSAQGFDGFRYDDVSWANELMGPFLGGLAESAARNPDSTFVDGGELYQLRSAQEFQDAYRWMKRGVATSATTPVPAALVDRWASHVSVGFGVADVDPTDGTVDVDDWQRRLSLAMARTDRWVWAYSEGYDWLGTGWPVRAVPDEWVDATRAAR